MLQRGIHSYLKYVFKQILMVESKKYPVDLISFGLFLAGNQNTKPTESDLNPREANLYINIIKSAVDVSDPKFPLKISLPLIQLSKLCRPLANEYFFEC